MIKKGIFILFVLFLRKSFGQDKDVLLKRYSDSLRYHEKELVRINYNDSFHSLIKKVLDESENPMLINFEMISQTISILESPNKKLKVITWTLVSDSQSYQNFGIVIHQKNPKSECKIFHLKPLKKNIKKIEFEDLNQDEWISCLYYQIYSFKKKGTDYYFLLGFDGQTSFSDKKIIEVLWFDKSEELHFGAPFFHEDERDFTPQYRVIYEYGNNAGMKLRFEPQAKFITYSNLVASNPSAKGLRQYYIPDGRIDYYYLNKKKKWIKKIDLINFEFLENTPNAN